jgi:hypothetical protein
MQSGIKYGYGFSSIVIPYDGGNSSVYFGDVGSSIMRIFSAPGSGYIDFYNQLQFRYSSTQILPNLSNPFTPLTINSGGINVIGNVDASGSVIIPRGQGYFLRETNGNLTTKAFIIDHPDKPQTHYLVHVCLEGPEAGVYYRGKGTITNNDSVSISLPDYVENLATNFTIQITPIVSKDRIPKIYETSEVENNSFQVYGPNGSFYWHVYGERSAIIVEPRKEDINVYGDGPYTYYKVKQSGPS